ncbi:MAG TPA: pilus assembly PilX N-terminal domain-containing protein [Thermoanaerobaculia bacterium]|nr:pilus assembly PilX N-terminal domain-containing protein [Thermoanaerobaculia bacterium]
MKTTRRPGRFHASSGKESGAALITAILVIFILTIFGLALLFTTTSEFQTAGAETVVNRAFYAADSGVQYGVQQAKFNQQQGPCTVGGTLGYWCFTVPERNPGATDRTLAVQVSPFRLVDFQLAPSTQLNVGATPLFNVGYHFDSFASNTLPGTSTISSQKNISVDVVVGPMPFILPNH